MTAPNAGPTVHVIERVGDIMAERNKLRTEKAALVAALELVRMSNGWRYMHAESQAIVDAAVALARKP